ncbi:hypothetical protein LBMAG42_17640 [Deltaproteobacteria bacterium]|nr:hypothetical protein LBMAG42_17640 [Deltaproteobacteria bacterium]
MLLGLIVACAAPEPERFTKVSAGTGHACGLLTTGEATCWGGEGYRETDPPLGEFIDLAAGGDQTCGIRPTGAIECWGLNEYGQATPPSGPFVSVAAGEKFACALDAAGEATCWGYLQGVPPYATALSSLSAGEADACGVTAEGGAVCWGHESYGDMTGPYGPFVAVDVAAEVVCTLNEAGALWCWGCEANADYGSCTLPEDETYAVVEGGAFHTCGLTTSGQIVCAGCGDDGYMDQDRGQCDAPEGSFVGLSSGAYQACALDSDGGVTCWGE